MQENRNFSEERDIKHIRFPPHLVRPFGTFLPYYDARGRVVRDIQLQKARQDSADHLTTCGLWPTKITSPLLVTKDSPKTPVVRLVQTSGHSLSLWRKILLYALALFNTRDKVLAPGASQRSVPTYGNGTLGSSTVILNLPRSRPLSNLFAYWYGSGSERRITVTTREPRYFLPVTLRNTSSGSSSRGRVLVSAALAFVSATEAVVTALDTATTAVSTWSPWR